MNTRRRFLKQTSAAAGGAYLFDIVPARALGLQGQPRRATSSTSATSASVAVAADFCGLKSNIGKQVPASTNLGGDGTRILRPGRSVALCDVDAKRLDEAATRVGGQPQDL